ncbi:hypothetical protein [Geomicrobium sediminis]|uniref:Uncharacterized protein n=1 Tax=Geomicrobium sediminis TaxID=1347788 RepID=A0ABS2PF07_9BACL|nr:hypothetical protein [Geomicrobium sediminis]MBM7633872.1 hypothetical protein [Geomicrobium sediminis]
MKVKLIEGEQLKNGTLMPRVYSTTKKILRKKIESGEYQSEREASSKESI